MAGSGDDDDDGGTMPRIEGGVDDDHRKNRKVDNDHDHDNNNDTRREHLERVRTLRRKVIPNLPNDRRRAVLERLRADDGQQSAVAKRRRGQRDELSERQSRALRRRKGDRRAATAAARAEVRRLESAVRGAEAEAVLHTERAGYLEAENETEDTLRVTQRDLKNHHLHEGAARQIFDLSLPHHGPYGAVYDRSGRNALLYGKRGHVALLDCDDLALKCEFYVTNGNGSNAGAGADEVVRDAVFLHNHTLFALAQKRHVYIYDDKGAEIHHLADHKDPFALEFLPYHWLLASVGRTGWLHYHDTSTGTIVAQHRTKMGPCDVLRQNPRNAVLHLGHSNGTVSLYSPALSEPLVKMQCHHGAPIRDLAVHPDGQYMVTAGADSKLKIWDLRTYRRLHTFTCMFAPPDSIDVSQRGLLGVAHGVHATIWSSDVFSHAKPKKPYMSHSTANAGGALRTIRFRPFEDVCALGASDGLSNVVVPGAGEPNLDSREHSTDPFQDTKRRREAEVRSLLDKLGPETIVLDPDAIVGTVEDDDVARLEDARRREEEANRRKGAPRPKNKMRGRNKIGKQVARKNQNVVRAGVEKRRKQLVANEENGDNNDDDGRRAEEEERKALKREAPTALKRFF